VGKETGGGEEGKKNKTRPMDKVGGGTHECPGSRDCGSKMKTKTTRGGGGGEWMVPQQEFQVGKAPSELPKY